MVLAAGGFYACAAKTPPGRGRAVVLTIVLRNVPETAAISRLQVPP
jgi:hypothetical protein